MSCFVFHSFPLKSGGEIWKKKKKKKKKGAAGTFTIIPANYPQLSKPLNSQSEMSIFFQWQRPRTSYCGEAGHLI